MDANDGQQYRFRLEPVQTVPQAVLARQSLKMKQAARTLLPPTQKDEKEGQKESATDTPGPMTLEMLIEKYQSDRDTLKKKKPATATREDSGLNFWKKKFGSADIRTIKNSQLSEFAQWRTKTHEVGGRAIDLNVMALEHVFEFARIMGILPEDHPDFRWTTLAGAPKKDELMASEQINELCNSALLDAAALKLLDPRMRHLRAAQELSGQAFYDYLRLLQHPDLEEHLKAMHEHLDPATDWLFPGRTDGEPIKRFNKQLTRAKKRCAKNGRRMAPHQNWRSRSGSTGSRSSGSGITSFRTRSWLELILKQLPTG